MSKFTTELRYICETYAGYTSEQDQDKVDEIIKAAAPIIFNFEFPIHEEDHRSELEYLILQHFYTREIGYETVGRWRLALRAKMSEIMPYFNRLYAALDGLNDPLADVDYTEEYHGTNSGTGSGSASSQNSSTSSGTSANAYSDTPEGTLSGVDSNAYLTDFRKITDSSSDSGSSSSTSSTSSSGQDDWTKRTHGRRGVDVAKRLQEYQNAVMNVDMMVINALEPLFFGLWD